MIVKMKEISWIKFILMHIITLGIYSLYWHLKITHERNNLLYEILLQLQKK